MRPLLARLKRRRSPRRFTLHHQQNLHTPSMGGHARAPPGRRVPRLLRIARNASDELRYPTQEAPGRPGGSIGPRSCCASTTSMPCAALAVAASTSSISWRTRTPPVQSSSASSSVRAHRHQARSPARPTPSSPTCHRRTGSAPTSAPQLSRSRRARDPRRLRRRPAPEAKVRLVSLTVAQHPIEARNFQSRALCCELYTLYSVC